MTNRNNAMAVNFALIYGPKPQPKTYRSKPREVEAVHFEKAGTYEAFGTLIQVEADTYAYMQDGHLMTFTGDKFRAMWEQV